MNANVPGQTLDGSQDTGVTNSGIMEATNGGTLLLNYPVVNTSTVLASGGTVQVAGTLSGGTLTSTGVSALQLLNSGTLSGVTLSPSSTAVVPAGNGPLVANGLTNNGTIYVQGKPGSQGGMLFDGSQTLSGSGSIVLALQGTDTSWTLLQTNDTLTQAAGHTISGAGKFFNATIVNQGLVNANVPGQTLDGSQDTGVTNSGIMEATNGGTLLLNYPVVNTSTVLASGGTVQVAGTLSGGTLTSTGVSALQLLNSGTLSGVTLSPSSTAVVPAGNGPLVANGLTNNGTIYVQGKPGSQGGMLFDGSQTLSGSGSIVLALQGTDTSWTLLQTNDTLTQAAGHTISGAGKFFNATIVNQGLVNANVPGQTLDGSQDTGVTNSGIMEATNGGTLLLNYPVVNTSTVLASGGTVQVAGTLSGGTLTSTGGSSSLTSNGGTLSGVTLSAGSQFNIPSGGTLTVTSGITNNGTITVDSPSGGTAASLVFSSSQTLSGSGSIVLAYSSAQLATSNSGMLTQAAGHTISGAGTLSAALNNQGLVNANVNGQTLYLATNPMTNTGTIETINAGELEINGIAVKNSGGTIQAVGGSVQITGGTIAGGTLANAGTASALYAAGNVLSGVTIAPGSQLDTYQGTTVTITGGLTNNGTITVGFNYLTHPGSLTFSGSQTLSGNGSVVLNFYPFSQINASNGGVLTQAAGSTIEGSGFIIAPLNNLGTVESNGYINIEGAVTQVSGRTLSGGTWIAEANSTLSITSGGTVSTNQATVILDGPNSVFSNVNPLTVNQGSFTVRDGGAFTTVRAPEQFRHCGGRRCQHAGCQRGVFPAARFGYDRRRQPDLQRHDERAGALGRVGHGAREREPGERRRHRAGQDRHSRHALHWRQFDARRQLDARL